MRRTMVILRIALVSVCAVGCSDGAKVAALEGETKRLSDAVESLNGQVRALQQWQDIDDAVEVNMGTARLTPGSDGYSIIRIGLGALTVSLENIESYANGSRVTLQFGNPLTATIVDGKATVEWGTKNPADVEKPHSREVNLSNIRSGAWTSVVVVLEGVPPTELSFVRVKNVNDSKITLMR